MRILIFIMIFAQMVCFSSCTITNNKKTEIEYQTKWDLVKKSYGLGEYDFCKSVSGFFSSDFREKQTVALFTHFLDNETLGYHRSCLLVEKGSEILFKDLSTDENPGSFYDDIYTGDIDADGNEEIIIQSTVGMSGGAGQFVSRVFDITDDGIVELFNSSNLNKFDTGYWCDIKTGYVIMINNKFTDYQYKIDLKDGKKYLNIFYDTSGKVINKSSILCDSFYDFKPIDVDDDGISELECRQYISLYGHSDYIGTARSILRYNKQKGVFEVVDSSFIEEGTNNQTVRNH